MLFRSVQKGLFLSLFVKQELRRVCIIRRGSAESVSQSIHYVDVRCKLLVINSDMFYSVCILSAINFLYHIPDFLGGSLSVEFRDIINPRVGLACLMIRLVMAV